jgi:uroporphyrinogen III methyltransferase/synthase
VHIIAGHAKTDETLDIDYAALVQTGGTLIFLMSAANIEQILNGLCSAKLDPSTPAAVIENGTRHNQR